MKKVKVFVIIIAVIAIAVGVVFVAFPYRIHFGARIKGSITLTLDGAPVQIGEEQFNITHDKKTVKNAKVTRSGDGCDFKIKGGKYGHYVIMVYIPEADKYIKVDVMHSNWWSVTEFSYDIKLSKDSDKVTYSYTTGIVEDGKMVHSSGEKTVDLDGQLLELRISNV